MGIEELISQIGGNIEGIQRGKREFEYGQYSGNNPRFQQEITNFTTRWENVFNFLDVNDSAAIDQAYIALDEDYKNYVRKYPEKMFDYDLVKNEATEMLDEFKGRSGKIQAGRNKLGELRTTLESYLDTDTVQMMINDYASGNKDKDNKDFRNHFVSNVAGIDKSIDDIVRGIYLTTAQDVEGKSYHKLRNNRFFNENLVGIDDDTLIQDIASAKDYIKALKGEMMTGVDAMLLLDSGDPWTATHQGVGSAEDMPYELRWNVTHDEAAQLKMVLDGDIKQTEYDKQESLELKQRQLAKKDVIENLKPAVNTYNHINSIIDFAEQVNQKPWAKIAGEDPLNLVKADGTPFLYKELKGEFTENVLGGNYKLLPAEIRNVLEGQAKIHPESPIALTKDLVQFWKEQNLDAITDEDARYFKNWDDKESEYPFPVELQNPKIYPQGLKNLLRGDDVRWSRKSSKYGQYGTFDYTSLNEDTGMLNMDDINVANLDSVTPVIEKDEFDPNVDTNEPFDNVKAKYPLNEKQLSVAKKGFNKFQKKLTKSIKDNEGKISSLENQLESKVFSFDKAAIQAKKAKLNAEIKSLVKSLMEQKDLLKNTDINTWVYTMNDERVKAQILSGITNAQAVQDYLAKKKR
tara:strand:+ start:11857 stop:13755 length:1899 start_codon:yes stop_codon:yes gene_type:complete